MPAIGDRLKELRDGAGMTQEQLAELLGTTGVAISRYEGNKRKPGCDVITKIAIAFQVSIDWLLGVSDKIRKTPLQPFYNP